MGASIGIPSIPIVVSPARPGESVVLRHPSARDYLHCGTETVLRMFHKSVDNHGDRNMLGTRTESGYEWLTYKQVNCMVNAAAVKLSKYQSGCIGIWGHNQPQWIISLLAIWSARCCCVTMYDTLGRDGIRHIVQETGLRVLITTREHAAEADALAAEFSVSIVFMDEMTELDASNNNASNADPMTDLAYIMYTSGTTGPPKGVMLTHGNVAAALVGVMHSNVALSHSDVYLSYLPLAHSFETCMVLTVVAVGGSVGFFANDVRKLTTDAQALRPTLFAGVPRVYTRIESEVMATINQQPMIKRGAVKIVAKLRKRLDRVKSILGGRVRIMVSGAAPLPDHTLRFLQVYFGCTVVQGYGMTENMGCACVTINGIMGPAPCTELKLIDAPEINYVVHSHDGKVCGEICLRGPNVFQGYFSDIDKTRSTLMPDGWLRTGDIGRLGKDNGLEIIDRRKHMFKLSQGEYVAVEQLETQLSDGLAQLWIYGDSLHDYLVAVAVASPGAVETEDSVRQRFLAVAKATGLPGFKVPRRVLIDPIGFTVDNGLLTPTMKLRRDQLKLKFNEQIHCMYNLDC